MNEKIESLYHLIGNEALGVASPAGGKVVVYSEIEDDTLATYVYCRFGEGILCKGGSPALDKVLYELWLAWVEIPGKREWRAIVYVIDCGKFTIELIYPDQFNNDVDEDVRRAIMVERFMGKLPIEYSQE